MPLHRISRLILTPQLVSASICLAMTVAFAETRQSGCGNEVEVEKGETLSDVAKRCGVTEARILDLNANVEGSKDLRPGMTLNLAAPSAEEAAAKANQAATSFLSRLKSYAKKTGQTIDRAAETAKQSLDQLIQRNPDLHQRILRLGQRLNIPGMEKVEAQVSLSVRKGPPGTPVTVSAIGLPANQRVEIAGGPPASDYRIIETARTGDEGTLQTTIEVPPWANQYQTFLFVVAIPKMNLALRSAKFEVSEQRS